MSHTVTRTNSLRNIYNVVTAVRRRESEVQLSEQEEEVRESGGGGLGEGGPRGCFLYTH